jgi:hypothetical protein
MVTLDSALDDIMKLDHASREMLLEILQKRQTEYRRDEIAQNIKKNLKDYNSGKLEALTADEAWKKLSENL